MKKVYAFSDFFFDHKMKNKNENEWKLKYAVKWIKLHKLIYPKFVELKSLPFREKFVPKISRVYYVCFVWNVWLYVRMYCMYIYWKNTNSAAGNWRISTKPHCAIRSRLFHLLHTSMLIPVRNIFICVPHKLSTL